MRIVLALALLVALLPASALADAAKPRHARPADTYACPMHCEGAKRYGAPRACPVCGMALALESAPAHRVTVTPADDVAPGVATLLTIAIADPQGTPVRDLEVVHEKLLHLLVVSADLSWFAHEHPERRPDGTFAVPITFPAPGRYTLFHDFTPPRIGMQVVPVEVTVAGAPPPPVPLAPDAGAAKTVDGFTVRLTPSRPLVAETNLALTVSLSRDGAPVRDLEPFLGAMGHLIIVSADRKRFVHSHPLERRGAPAPRGPDVRFQCQFPTAGRYKAWAQFQHAGRILTVPFTLEVGGAQTVGSMR